MIFTIGKFTFLSLFLVVVLFFSHYQRIFDLLFCMFVDVFVCITIHSKMKITFLFHIMPFASKIHFSNIYIFIFLYTYIHYKLKMLLHICLSIVVTVVIVVAFTFIHIQLNVDYFNCTRFHNMLYLRFIPTNIIEYFFRMPIANFTLVVQLRAILFVVVCCSTETFR